MNSASSMANKTHSRDANKPISNRERDKKNKSKRTKKCNYLWEKIGRTKITEHPIQIQKEEKKTETREEK